MMENKIIEMYEKGYEHLFISNVLKGVSFEQVVQTIRESKEEKAKNPLKLEPIMNIMDIYFNMKHQIVKENENPIQILEVNLQYTKTGKIKHNQIINGKKYTNSGIIKNIIEAKKIGKMLLKYAGNPNEMNDKYNKFWLNKPIKKVLIIPTEKGYRILVEWKDVRN